ncbi:unnamed protein product [Pneumocystis jirovecii]|uniref:Inositol-pentakisphosphate 2-kinase n=1 Tax=Pneumocystis jirovecii TaxID=42068 RepID=L0PB02_PNEJI|nr:unnamed protein product [Pneumocystis jirovecii]
MDIDQLAKIDPSDWIYFSEGNRNINKVLRIKKTQHPISTLENLKFIQSIIIPLFYEPFDRYILSIELIMVEIAVLKKFNIDLIQKYERKKKFSNTLLDISENHAFLLKDLSSSFPKHTIEFKPKWLIQSVSAPIGWKSCRTCALRRLRGDISGNGTRYCPLDLASENQTRIQKSIKAILIKNQIYNQNIEINLSTYLQRSQLINHLKYLQSSSPRTLNCKSQTKVEYWDKIEQQLIDEGWYLGRGMANDEEPCLIL